MLLLILAAYIFCRCSPDLVHFACCAILERHLLTYFCYVVGNPNCDLGINSSDHQNFQNALKLICSTESAQNLDEAMKLPIIYGTVIPRYTEPLFSHLKWTTRTCSDATCRIGMTKHWVWVNPNHLQLWGRGWFWLMQVNLCFWYY